MMLMRWSATLLIAVLGALPALAQDAPTSQPIRMGSDVTGAITQAAFFDHWLLTVGAGERFRVTMRGADGLAPLVGILTEGGTLLARSDDGAANGTVSLEFDVPEGGTYIIITTRAGNEAGTSSGTYTLRVDRLVEPTRSADFQDVVFQCGRGEATALVTFEFKREDADNGAYSMRVYGLDGLQPVIRVQSGDYEACITERASEAGDVITLPGERPLTITPDDLATTVQHVITGEHVDPDSIIVTFGSMNGTPGRYFAAVGGFTIAPSSDADDLIVRLAPRPARDGSPLLLYVIGVNNRLDPGIADGEAECDDAGRRGCEDVPSAEGVGVRFAMGVQVTGDRFDAGIRLEDADVHELVISSFSGTTHGEYALILVGGLGE